MAGLLQSIGSVKSAMEVYQQLEMWEHVIACYQVLGMHEKVNKWLIALGVDREGSKWEKNLFSGTSRLEIMLAFTSIATSIVFVIIRELQTDYQRDFV